MFSPSAEGEEGSAPSTARAFEKIKRASALTKTFVKLTKLVRFVYTLRRDIFDQLFFVCICDV